MCDRLLLVLEILSHTRGRILPNFCCIPIALISLCTSLSVVAVVSATNMSCTMCSELFTPGAVPEILRNHENRMCLPTLSFSQYLDYLQARGQANCTTVWTKGTVAYRCRTCQVNDSRFGIKRSLPLLSSSSHCSFVGISLLTLSFSPFFSLGLDSGHVKSRPWDEQQIDDFCRFTFNNKKCHIVCE